jgi:hypothetical protein
MSCTSQSGRCSTAAEIAKNMGFHSSSRTRSCGTMALLCQSLAPTPTSHAPTLPEASRLHCSADVTFSGDSYNRALVGSSVLLTMLTAAATSSPRQTMGIDRDQYTTTHCHVHWWRHDHRWRRLPAGDLRVQVRAADTTCGTVLRRLCLPRLCACWSDVRCSYFFTAGRGTALPSYQRARGNHAATTAPPTPAVKAVAAPRTGAQAAHTGGRAAVPAWAISVLISVL